MSEGMGIQDLPDEILLKVFQNFNSSTLLNFTLVCKRWNELIGNSVTIMKKWRIVIKPSTNSESLIRKFHSIKMIENYLGDQNTIRNKQMVLDQICPELRFLEIWGWKILKGQVETVNEFFESMKKLETLKLSHSFLLKCIHKDHDNRFFLKPVNHKKLKTVHLNNLKTVVLKDCDIHILKFIGSTQLTSLKIEFKRKTTEFTDFFNDFLAGQTKLEELAICYTPWETKQHKFNWENLKPDQCKRLSLCEVTSLFVSEESFLVFINKFANSVEELEIIGNFPVSFYETIFMKFHKLKTLSMGFSYIAPLNIHPNSSLRKLIFSGFNLRMLQEIVSKYPNIETLVFYRKLHKVEFETISNLKMLTDLQVCDSTERCKFDGICIPSLKTIKIKNLAYSRQEKFGTMIRALPNIEVLQVEAEQITGFEDTYQIFRKKIVNIIAKGWPKLKHVKIGRGFIAKYENFVDLLRKCKNLETVEICESAFKSSLEKELVLRNFKRDGLRLIIHSKEDFKIDECNFDLWKDDKLPYSGREYSRYVKEDLLVCSDDELGSDDEMNSVKKVKLTTDDAH